MAHPVVGDRLAGRYDVRALATARQTGLLFRGFDEQIGVDVALRVIDDELLVDETERHAFVQKATRAKTLQHPNLIRLYDILVDDSSVFLVMQWAPGERLSSRLSKGNTLELADARSVIRRVAAGVAHAHQHGVVIGNLRAETIILYPDGLKLTSVGIGPALPRARFLSMLSDRGALLELAPELRAGSEPDERADVFALARLARRLFAEQLLPESALAVLARGLSEDSAFRPRDVEGFVRDLDGALDGKGLDRSYPMVPTGYDTERVDRLPPLPAPDFTQPDARADVLVEPTENRSQQLTVGGRSGSRVVELDSGDLIEATLGLDAGEGRTVPLPRADPSPEITDVGRRSPVRFEDSLSELMPTEELLPALPRTEANPIVSVEPPKELLPALPRTAANPVFNPPPQANPIVQLPSGPLLALPREQMSEDDIPMLPSRPKSIEEDPDTNPRPKLNARDPFLLPSTLEVAMPRQNRHAANWMPVVIACAIVSGAVLVLAGLRSMQHHAPAPIVVQVSPAPVAPRVVAPAATPVPVVSAIAPGVCPLGMARMSTSHPYCVDLYEYPGGHTIPRTQVSFSDASRICQGRNLRLCSDAEWEGACRGPSNASFPYGSSYDAQRCNTGGKTATGSVLPAGSMPRCRSASGAYDMSGNVAEWTSSASQRGGSVLLGPPNGRCSHAIHGADQNGASDVGFRCCGDVR